MDNILSNLQAILSNGLFGITLTIVGYLIGLWLNRKFKTPILNPLLRKYYYGILSTCYYYFRI